MAKATSKRDYQVQFVFSAFVGMTVEASSLEQALELGKEMVAEGMKDAFSTNVEIIEVEDPRVQGVFEV
jgi:hypothetical protein